NLAFIVGTETDAGADAQVYTTITGLGSLVVNTTGDMAIRQSRNAAGSGQAIATLDLSGLKTFTATVDQFSVGFNPLSTQVNRPTGKLILRDTSTITARNTARSLVIGGAS